MESTVKILKAFSTDRSNLIRALQAVQKDETYISDDAIIQSAKYFGISEVDVEGVVSFYTQFKRVKPGKFQIAVCDGTACHIKGSPLITGWITEELGIKPGETDEKGMFSLDEVACLGCCSLAPVISVNAKVFGKLDRKALKKVLKEYRKGAAQ